MSPPFLTNKAGNTQGNYLVSEDGDDDDDDDISSNY